LWSIWKAVFASVRGKPIWQEKKLRDLLDRLLTAKGIKSFGDLEKKKGVKLFVIASDVTHSQKVVYDGAEDLLVGSLLDSCGLPFFYRCAAVGGGRVTVDGGLCENFPADELGEEKEYGDILGISLDSPTSGTNPSNLMQFTVSLLNTAINNSVLRAQSRLGNRLLRLQTSIDTFDFKGAITNGFDSGYDTAKATTSQFLNRFVDSYKQGANVIAPVRVMEGRVEASVSHVEVTDVEVFRGRDWEEQSVEFMMDVYNIYFSQHARQKFHYGRVTCEIIANSTLAEDEVGYGALDVITNTNQFRPLPDQPLYCHAVSWLGTGNVLESSVLNERWWTCADPDGKPINTIALPAINPDNRKEQCLVFFFTPRLTYQGDDRMYTLRLRDRVKGTLEDLVRTKRDTVGMGFKRAAGSISLADIVVYLPQRLSASARITGSRPSGTGQPLTSAELRVSYPEPQGFVALGWRSRDLDQDAVFSVDIGI